MITISENATLQLAPGILSDLFKPRTDFEKRRELYHRIESEQVNLSRDVAPPRSSGAFGGVSSFARSGGWR